MVYTVDSATQTDVWASVACVRVLWNSSLWSFISPAGKVEIPCHVTNSLVLSIFSDCSRYWCTKHPLTEMRNLLHTSWQLLIRFGIFGNIIYTSDFRPPILLEFVISNCLFHDDHCHISLFFLNLFLRIKSRFFFCWQNLMSHQPSCTVELLC